MTSRAPTPDLTRRSNLPVSVHHTIQPRNETTHATRGLSSNRPPPSPPRSPTPVEAPAAAPALTRKERWLAYETELRGNEGEQTRVPKDHDEKNDSLDTSEYERFSPVPWVMSPPMSPPTHTGVAILSSHIDTGVPPVWSSSAETGVTNSPTSPTITNGKASRILTDELLQEFPAIETAFIKSPYVIPDNLL